VRDDVPVGMTAVSASDGADLSSPADSVTWSDLPSLSPGEQATLTVAMAITDLTQREFVNFAEIVDDGADAYTVGGVPVTDADSTPGDPETNGVDTDLIDEAGVGDDAGFDDEDVAMVTIEVRYDLALIKVVESPVEYDATPEFVVSVLNQGNVPSGEFTVVDLVPAGLAAESAGQGGVVSVDGSEVTWTVADLAPGASVDLTLRTRITDLTRRPFVNVAEIVADGASSYSNETETVTDVDSVPGDEATSDVDNTDVSQAGLGADAGFDDEDVAVLDVPVSYDLALVKRLPPGQRLRLGDVVTFEIDVMNQGNVPSGAYSVQDVLPAGMSAVSASDGGVVTPTSVAWNDLASLDPGMVRTMSIVARLDDVTMSSYVNRAEIMADSASTYSTPSEAVRDVDSIPDTDVLNDAVIDNDDVHNDIPGDEDDHDIVELDMAQVRADNLVRGESAPARSPAAPALAFTGYDPALPVGVGAMALALGLALVLRRRRKGDA
jgi:uncharacterized repeat protein (TIGR01451 family)